MVASSGEVAAGNAVSLDDAALSKIADPPVFAVRDVTIPESAAHETSVTVSVTVENAGGTDGTFRLNVTSETLSGFHYPSVAVPAGETVTATADIQINEENEEVVTVDWGSGRTERTVTVTSG